MKLNLVYRDICTQPNHKYFKKFDAESILEWYQSFWRFYDDDRDVFYDAVKQFIGNDVLFFETNFIDIDSFVKLHSYPPKDYKELLSYLKYNQKVELINESALQVYVDEGQVEGAYCLFSDEYAKNNMSRCAYLIHPTWELPESFEEKGIFKEDFEMMHSIEKYPKGEKEGTTYICVFSNWTHLNVGNHYLKKKLVKIEGIRVDGLNNYLKENQPNQEWNLDISFIRTQIENDSFADTLINYSKIPDFYIKVIEYSNYFKMDKILSKDIEEGRNYIIDYHKKNKELLDNAFFFWGNSHSDKKPNQSKFQFSEHLIQASIHTQTWTWHPVSRIDGNFPNFDHFIIFDELWATANPDLANSILRFTTMWNVLS